MSESATDCKMWTVKAFLCAIYVVSRAHGIGQTPTLPGDELQPFIDSVLHRISVFEQEMTVMKGENIKLRTALHQHGTEIESLKKENEDLKNRFYLQENLLRHLEKSCKSKSRNITAQLQGMTRIESSKTDARVKETEYSNDSPNRTTSGTINRIQAKAYPAYVRDNFLKHTDGRANSTKSKRLLADLQNGSTSPLTVAFFAQLSGNEVNPGINQNIVFDHEVTNIGGGYNRHHGAFVAPKSGVYVFITTVLTTPNGEVHAALVLNGNVVSRAYGSGSDSRHDQGSAVAVLQLKQGDNLWVKTEDNYSHHDNSVNGGVYSTFSGFLLFSMKRAS